MRAHDLVTEILDRPYPVKIFKDQAVARDERGMPLYVVFDRYPAWETVKVTFDRGKGFELTKWGNEFRIFATVVSAIEQWSTQYQPGSMYFSVENNEPNNRQRLYDRMVKKLAASTDYELVSDPVLVTDSDIRFYMAVLGRRFSGARYWWLVRRDLVNSAPTVTEAASAGVTQTQLYVPRPNGLIENWSIKPQGVLWTSTARKTKDGWTSDWVEWCRSNQPDWLSEQGILYDIGPGAQFLNLNTDRDAVKAARRYGVEISNEYELFRSMPWKKIARDFDAIHHVPSHRAGNLFMSTWDVESTAWFDRSHLVNPRQVKISGTPDQPLDESRRHDAEWTAAVDRHVRLRAMAKRDGDEAKFDYHNAAIKKLYGYDNPPVTPDSTFTDDPGGIEIDENSYSGSSGLLYLDPWTFDQTPNGWRGLSTPQQQVEALRKYIRTYVKNGQFVGAPGEGSRLPPVILYWHLGQILAIMDQYAPAMAAMQRARDKSDPAWTAYVNATMAWLKKQRAEFDLWAPKAAGNEDAMARLAAGWEQTYKQAYFGEVNENFADGRVQGKSRPGRVKRAGASCAGSVTSLRQKAAKYSGERGRMYHWCANMKSGRNKNK